MNHKVQINKLDVIKRDKLEEINFLRQEISKIEESIRYHTRKYNENNKLADDANNLLSGYDKQNIREIIFFFLYTFTTEGYGRPKSILDRLDYDKAVKDLNFFDLVIVNVGEATIKNLHKHFEGVGVDSEGTYILRRDKAPKSDKNLGDRLFSKFTKPDIRKYVEENNLLKDE